MPRLASAPKRAPTLVVSWRPAAIIWIVLRASRLSRFNGAVVAEFLTLTVLSLDCERCAAEVEDTLSMASGVESVGVDLPRSVVRVRFNAAQISGAKIVALLDEAGYPSCQYQNPPVADTEDACK